MKDQFFASQRKRVAYKKVSAAFLMLSLNLSLGGVGAMLLGSQVAYAASGYAVSVTSATPSGLTLSLVGTTSAHPYVGSTGQQHVQVTSWGDSSALTDASTDLTFGGSGGSKFFDGTWSASHLYVAAGTYTITVKVCHQGCTGAEGSDFSTATTVVVIPPTDTTAPVIAFHADISAVEAASPAGAIVIYTAPATSDNVDPAGIAICSPASGSTFPLGQSIVTCNATDAAGNHASPTTFKVTVVDTTAPVIAAHSDVAAEATAVTGAVVTYITSATTDAIDGAGVATCLPASGALFAFGDTTVHCTAMDAAGNIAAPKSFVVHVVDTTAPAITLQTPASPTSGASTDFTVIDLFSILSVKCTVNGAGVVDENCSSPFAPLLGDGTYTITISAKDVNGNIVQSTTASFTVDLTAPDVSIDTHPIMPTTSSTDAAFTFHSEAGAILTCALDTTEFSSCSSPFGQPVVEGTHTFTVHATDEAGNVGADSFTWTVDTTAPTVAIIAPTVTDTTGPSGSVTYTVGDGTVVCTLDGEPVDCGNTVASFTGLSDGDHTFTVTSTDTAGNSTSQSVTWHVDAIGPVVTITSGPDEGSTVNTTSATLGFTSEEGATFECQLDDVGFTACESTKTYDTLSDGPHTFKVHATDTYGNVGSDVSRTWTVNTTPATPTCETNQTLVDGHCVTNETPQPPTGGGNGGGGSGGGSSSYDYWGCTNSSAINFNALANKDDGSCQIPGGNGGGTVTPPAAPQGEVLGAATTTGDLALPAACRANPYLRDYLKLGKKNDADQVKMLQTFLNEEMHAQLPVSGFFGSLTKSWVKKLQKTHKAEILQPWVDAGYKSNISDGTGYVYKTTKRFINMTKCAEATIPMPELTPDLGN